MLCASHAGNATLATQVRTPLGGGTDQNLPVEVKSPPLQGSNRCVDVALRTGVTAGLGSAGEWLDLMVSEGFSNPSDPVVLLTVLQTLIPHFCAAQVSFRQCSPLSAAPRVPPHLWRRGHDGHLPCGAPAYMSTQEDKELLSHMRGG